METDLVVVYNEAASVIQNELDRTSEEGMANAADR
jgi:hypothetical protein